MEVHQIILKIALSNYNSKINLSLKLFKIKTQILQYEKFFFFMLNSKIN
jgi:hypothetical protein